MATKPAPKQPARASAVHKERSRRILAALAERNAKDKAAAKAAHELERKRRGS